MTSDAETLSVYGQRAAEYADMAVDPEQITVLANFVGSFDENARVLDYGCGPGHAAAEMLQHRLTVDAFDASPEMVRLVSKHEGVNARVKTFEQFNAKNRYQGIWASFSLLHAPKSNFPGLLLAIHDALLAGGLFTIGMKLGTGEKRDTIGRKYTYYTQAELTEHLETAGFRTGEFVLGSSVGLDGATAPFIVINAHA